MISPLSNIPLHCLSMTFYLQLMYLMKGRSCSSHCGPSTVHGVAPVADRARGVVAYPVRNTGLWRRFFRMVFSFFISTGLSLLWACGLLLTPEFSGPKPNGPQPIWFHYYLKTLDPTNVDFFIFWIRPITTCLSLLAQSRSISRMTIRIVGDDYTDLILLNLSNHHKIFSFA